MGGSKSRGGEKKPKVREDGTVDYREIETIATVGEGDLIAVVHPPQQGKPGLTVTNEVIPVKEVHPVTIKLGKGVTMDENRILAVQGGRPQIAKKENSCRFHHSKARSSRRCGFICREHLF